MVYHETFWTVAGTAAPVIALAAVVALSDSTRAMDLTSNRWRGVKRSVNLGNERMISLSTEGAYTIENRESNALPPEQVKAKFSEMEIAEAMRRIGLKIILMSSIALLAQAILLTISLCAVAYGLDVIPPWIAIILAVGGLLILTVATIRSCTFRTAYERWSNFSHNLKDDTKEL